MGRGRNICRQEKVFSHLAPPWPRGITERQIGHFTVMCFVTWPWIESEAGGDLVLIQTSLFFICKYKLVNMRTA